MMTLEMSHEFLKELIRAADEDSTIEGTTFYRCTFKPKRIHLTYTQLHPDHHFESGVIKIQRNLEKT